jgi:hypothetical protein
LFPAIVLLLAALPLEAQNVSVRGFSGPALQQQRAVETELAKRLSRDSTGASSGTSPPNRMRPAPRATNISLSGWPSDTARMDSRT